MSGAEPIEVMLLRWSESPAGRTATFLFPDDTPEHPFKGLRTGATNGERLELKVKLIADDESTHEIMADASYREDEGGEPESEAENPSAAKPKREMTLANRIGALCDKKEFQDFLRVSLPAYWASANGDTDSEVAGWVIKDFIGVDSRTKILYDTPNADVWKVRFYEPYESWLGKQS